VVIGRRSLLLAGVALSAAASAHAQCVTDTPAVDACLGGVRTTVVVPAPTLALDFMTPGTLPSGVVIVRNSVGTYFDSAGVIQTAAINTPRWDYDPVSHVLRGLLVEDGPRTNLLLNSAALGTQSVTVTATAYTLSFYGTGTITLSGVSTAGPLTGTGAFPARVSLTFTPTAGSLTLTVTGSVLNAQIEAGAWATSWIPTAGATAQRNSDALTLPVGGWFNAAASSLVAEYMVPLVPNPGANPREAVSLTDGTTVNRMTIRGLNTGGTASQATFLSTVASTLGQSNGLGVVTALAVTKAGAAWDGANPIGSLNGGATVTYAGGMPAGINVMWLGGAGPVGFLNGWLRRVGYYNRALSATELRAVTT
jgi:hypothetical protein